MAKNFRSKSGIDETWWTRNPIDGEIKYGISNDGQFPLTDDARNSWGSSSLDEVLEDDKSTITRDHNTRKK